jgi:hypothetical protein
MFCSCPFLPLSKMINEKRKVINEQSTHLSLFVFHLSLTLRGYFIRSALFAKLQLANRCAYFIAL